MDTPQTNRALSATGDTAPYTSWRPGLTLASDRGAGQPIGGAAGAPPSNTAPANYTEPPQGAQVVAAGLDSLYLSYRGGLRPSWASELEFKKLVAQSPDPRERCLAQTEIAGFLFCVEARGVKGFSYLLQGDFFRIQISTAENENRPLAIIQIASELLWQCPLDDILIQLGDIIHALGSSTGTPSIHRADLSLDFSSSYPFSGTEDRAWICRSKKLHRYTENGELSGWSFGRGGDISARLYNKTLEIKKTNKHFFKTLWEEGGWDGQSVVWRLEYQLRRPVLNRFKADTPDSLRECLASLWSYCTESWLRLVVPSDTDSNQTRWPTSPLWLSLQSFPPPEEFTQREVDLTVKPKAPNLPWLYSHHVGVLTSFMALTGIADPAHAHKKLLDETEAHFNALGSLECPAFPVLVEKRIREKNRRFNLRLNKASSHA